jgi:hypothetical protein
MRYVCLHWCCCDGRLRTVCSTSVTGRWIVSGCCSTHKAKLFLKVERHCIVLPVEVEDDLCGESRLAGRRQRDSQINS